MDFMSARDAAEKWGISQRRVAILCSENRINDAVMVGNMWIIPINAKKPIDARATRYSDKTGKGLKPFLKWVGGKGQLLSEIKRYYQFDDEKITKYAEPFVGGGAVLFDILNHYDLSEIYISDVNEELINSYRVIRDDVESLIELLSTYQDEYIPMDMDKRKEYYIDKRARFNELKINHECIDHVEKAALMIFLNKTCFNGLYRVNKKGAFNVPMGVYKNPLICDYENLQAISDKLDGVEIVCGDYKKSESFIDSNTFVYFDPPYRPLTETASFTSYTSDMFFDEQQRELAEFVEAMSVKGAKIVVSNSDPKNTDVNDNFFDDIYSKQKIRRVEATRMINSKASGRGKIKELLISNF